MNIVTAVQDLATSLPWAVLGFLVVHSRHALRPPPPLG